MACATNQDLSHFCSEHPSIPGCEQILETAEEKALDGVVNNAVEKMAEKVGGAKAERIVDRYLERNPDLARKNLMNLSTEAFDTVTSIETSMLKPQEDDHSDEDRASMRRKNGKIADEEDVDADEDDDEDEDLHAGEQTASTGINLKSKKAKRHNETSTFSLSDIQSNPWVVAICSLFITAVSGDRGWSLMPLPHLCASARASTFDHWCCCRLSEQVGGSVAACNHFSLCSNSVSTKSSASPIKAWSVRDNSFVCHFARGTRTIAHRTVYCLSVRLQPESESQMWISCRMSD